MFMMLMCLFVFFTYAPSYMFHAVLVGNWLFTGIAMGFMVISAIVLNIWSKKILTKQSRIRGSDNDTEIRTRKRNKTAVGILNAISLIYVLCILPLSIFYVCLGILMINFEDYL